MFKTTNSPRETLDFSVKYLYNNPMLKINHIKKGMPVYEALASETRVNILSLLREKGSMNFSEIAQALELTNGSYYGGIKNE